MVSKDRAGVRPSLGRTQLSEGGDQSPRPKVCEASASSHEGASAEGGEWEGGKGGKLEGGKGGKLEEGKGGKLEGGKGGKLEGGKGGKGQGWGWWPGLPRKGPGV